MNTLFSVGIDAAKGKSTICILNQYGECISKPYDVKHSKDSLNDLSDKLQSLKEKGEVKVIMEVTGIYHWPIFKFLKDKGFFVSVNNPLMIKNYAKSLNFRNVKTDKIDSEVLAIFCSEKWNTLTNSELDEEDDRTKLKTLARAYDAYQKPKVNLKQILDLELEKSIPGIAKVIKDEGKLYDFILELWHYDNITKYKEEKFAEKMMKWAKKKGYRFQQNTPHKIYSAAKDGIQRSHATILQNLQFRPLYKA